MKKDEEFELLETSAEFVHRSGAHVPELEELPFSFANNSQQMFDKSVVLVEVLSYLTASA